MTRRTASVVALCACESGADLGKRRCCWDQPFPVLRAFGSSDQVDRRRKRSRADTERARCWHVEPRSCNHRSVPAFIPPAERPRDNFRCGKPDDAPTELTIGKLTQGDLFAAASKVAVVERLPRTEVRARDHGFDEHLMLALLSEPAIAFHHAGSPSPPPKRNGERSLPDLPEHLVREDHCQQAHAYNKRDGFAANDPNNRDRAAHEDKQSANEQSPTRMCHRHA
jgi:hypothetical protein